MKTQAYSLLILVGLASAPLLFADEADTAPEETADELLAGHSAHGEAFNEGPRQSAYYMGSTGNVYFPITTPSTETQRFFNQGIGQLHGFWYLEAERTFRHIAANEPECAMAYWGMAMANINNEKRAKVFIKEAVSRKESVSPREQLWITSLENFYLGEEKDIKKRTRKLIRDLEEIVYQYPDDIEAKAFLAVSIYQGNRHNPINSHQAVSSLIQQVFDANPMHPAHHYRIHLWDREKPERAVTSAARCGQSAPGIAHMWHMPGHIFSRLHRYADAAWQQEASARVDHAQMVRNRLLPDQIFNFAHNNEWLIRNLNHLGRIDDAIDLAKNMIELPRHPQYNVVSKRGRSSSYGRTRLLETLVRYELWEDLQELAGTVYLEPTDVDWDQIQRQLSLGAAAYHLNQLDQLKEIRKPLESLLAKKKTERIEAADKAEQTAREEDKKPKEIAEAMTNAMMRFNRPIDSVHSALATLDTYIAILENRPESAKEHLEAIDGMPKEQLARLHLKLENEDKAVELIEEAVKNATNQVQILASAVEIYHQTGNVEKAKEAFQTLRETSGYVDLDAPIFRRLTALAPELEIDSNWKIAYHPPSDVGIRPPLDSLGPFRWAPPAAPSWKLESTNDDYISLNDFQGKPVLLVFYLGYGCAHCVEQLNEIDPRIDQFKAQGIEVIAVSTENIAQLKESLTKSALLGELHFPLVANDQLDVFKKYRAFDDFEDTPLHGTYLIDGDGLVRWQDISYEPFNDIDFILKEAKRLLAQPKAVEVARSE